MAVKNYGDFRRVDHAGQPTPGESTKHQITFINNPTSEQVGGCENKETFDIILFCESLE
jgi:hypothetical protein